MNYPIKTLNQLPLILKGFRKERGVTQAAMAEKLGITQQSYAYFEANPTTATLDRLFMVLRILSVEISLEQAASVTSPSHISSDTIGETAPIYQTLNQNITKTVRASIIKKEKTSADIKPGRIISTTMKKESW